MSPQEATALAAHLKDLSVYEIAMKLIELDHTGWKRGFDKACELAQIVLKQD